MDKKSKQVETKIIRVAILADEPLGWGSGKHYFPLILNGYSWKTSEASYKIITDYVYDKEIIRGKLVDENYDVLLAPGGGVGDGESIVKGFNFLPSVRRWKLKIREFIQNGGGYVGICGGTALITDLKTGPGKDPTSIYERLYNKSALGITSVSSYYKDLALPILNSFQYVHPEKIGATGYVFSFAPGETADGKQIHSGGVPVDFQICKDNPIFADYKEKTIRIRWWGGPGLLLPENSDREIKVLAKYPEKDFSMEKNTKIKAWIYCGGIIGLAKSFFKSFRFIKKEKDSLRNLILYTYCFAGNWGKSDSFIELNYSNMAGMTAEIYPNENKGRIVLCAAHPEYMIWWGGNIEEVNDSGFNCLGTGLHKWKNIKPLSKTLQDEFTYTWWIVRRITCLGSKSSRWRTATHGKRRN